MFFQTFLNAYVKREAETGGEGAAAGGPAPAAPAAPTAPVAPVAPVAPEEKDAPEPAAPEDNGMQQYIDKHSEANPALGLALGFLRDNGISPTDPAFVAAEVDGDFTMLKAMLAAKGAAGTDAMVAILEKAVGDHQAAVEAHEAQTTAIVEGILGEQKDDILEWARSTASDEEKEQFNDMFEAGGVYARAAAMLLRSAYADTGATLPAKNPVTAAKPGAGNAGPLTARDYAAAVDKLAKEMRGDPRNSPQYAQLTRQRQMGRARGI